MRPAASARRVRRSGLAAVVAVGLAVGSTAAAGCTAQQAIDRAALVNDLATRLDHASQRTYTADYQLPHGEMATIAQSQHPLRAAYTFPGGKVTITPEAITDCRGTGGAMTCTLTPPPSPGTGSTTGLISAVGGVDHAGVVVPALVVGLLTAASLDSNAVISQHDTTIAGEHATCVNVTGVDNAAAPEFTACITVGGILGSFEGTINGVPVEISMTGLRDTVAGNAFDPPAGAKIVDRRPHQ